MMLRARVRPQAVLRPDGTCRVALFPGDSTEAQITQWIRDRNWAALSGKNGVRWYSPWRRRWMTQWSDAMMREEP